MDASPDPIERLSAMADELERGADVTVIASELRAIAEELNVMRNPQ